MEVAFPAAVVIVAPATNTVVPAGANQFTSAADPATMVTAAPPCLDMLVGKIVFWLVGAVSSTVKVAVEAVEKFPTASRTNNL